MAVPPASHQLIPCFFVFITSNGAYSREGLFVSSFAEKLFKNTTGFDGSHLLEGDKYGPNGGALWKRVNARFPALYKALIAEPDKDTRVARLKRAVSETG